MSASKTLNCWFCDGDVKIEGPDAIVFIHRGDGGICEDCLLLCMDVYSNARRSNLANLKFRKEKDAQKQ